ncbi:glycosyltransferase [Falsiroseomonas sp.]|uniref:glycosyltransferase n=1 Tax=Falsiroseomonas sp. TaxID=2870721 RepID=UPI0034A24A10
MQQDPRAALIEAEAKRDMGDWRGAADAYARYLAANPADWAIWVQHGHCVKEAGDPRGAIASYRRAEAGMPGDPDLPLQIGHALKRAGDLAGARAAYARALDLDPTGEDAWREVSALCATQPDAEGSLSLLGDLRVVFDLSDLIAWFDGARAPTGIQRIQMDVASAALASGLDLAEVRLAAFRPESGTWREIPREAFRRLCGLSRAGADAADPAWAGSLGQLRAMREGAPDLAFAPGAWLVNLGSSWWLPGYHRAVRDARARHGLRYAAMVHDTGPVTAPEHSPPETSASFARWFSVLLQQADLLLAPSEATAREIARLAATDLAGLPAAPVRVLRPDAMPSAPPRGTIGARVAEWAGEPHVLFLGTIESRKDHLFVLNAWLALLRRHGDAVPPLVLAGRAGFNAGPALALLRRAPALAERVIWLDAVSDAEAAALLRGALFTIYHSRLEGWGLPVTEALAAGKAVVTPAHSALVEAGQGLALHHAPGSEPAFLAVIEQLLFEPGFREAAEARIAAGLRLRDWAAVADELRAALAEAPPGPPPAPLAPPLGLVHPLGQGGALRPSAAMAWAELLRMGGGWHGAEAWGCWTRPGRALLSLPLPAQAATPLRLHVALRGADAARQVTLRVGRGPRQMLDVPAGARPVAVVEIASPGATADLVIEAAPMEAEDTATGIGVAAVMACAPDDVGARLGFLERLSFVWPEFA